MKDVSYLTIQNQIKNLSLGYVKGSLVKDLGNFYIHYCSSNYNDLYLMAEVRNTSRDIASMTILKYSKEYKNDI